MCFFVVYSIIGFPIYVGSWVRTQHTYTFLYLVLKVTSGVSREWSLLPRKKPRLGSSQRHPQELPGAMKVTEAPRTVRENRKERKGSEELSRQRVGFSEGVEGGLGGREEVGGEAGLFCEIQTSGLSIDPWQNTRTNHDGLICALGADKTGTSKRLPAPRQAIPI